MLPLVLVALLLLLPLVAGLSVLTLGLPLAARFASLVAPPTCLLSALLLPLLVISWSLSPELLALRTACLSLL